MHSLTEWGLIGRSRPDTLPGNPAAPLAELALPDVAFDALRQLATAPDTSADPVLTYFWQRGRECIRVKNYVGLIDLPDGSQLEILPKVPQARQALVNMLRYVRHSPFRSLGPARQRSEQLPLWEVFVATFAGDVGQLLVRGRQQQYVARRADLPVLRGKWRVAEQLRQADRPLTQLAVSFDELTADCPPNRLVKLGLHYVLPRTRHTATQAHVRQLLDALADVSLPTDPAADWRAVRNTGARTKNRLFAHYVPVLRWVELLTAGRSFGGSVGTDAVPTLLFSMERIFEEYVAAGFQRVVTDGEVRVQEASAYLVDAHLGNPKFRLRPDIRVCQNGRTTVIDTKWKWIDGSNRHGHYGIDQADLYQLYAYGKKYAADELVLIYPAHAQFRTPLDDFGYDPTLRLRVVPFDVTRPLTEEVQRVLAGGD